MIKIKLKNTKCSTQNHLILSFSKFILIFSVSYSMNELHLMYDQIILYLISDIYVVFNARKG